MAYSSYCWSPVLVALRCTPDGVQQLLLKSCSGGTALHTGCRTAVTVEVLFFELSTEYLKLGFETKWCPSKWASLKCMSL
jgi:hypothetical protein